MSTDTHPNTRTDRGTNPDVADWRETYGLHAVAAVSNVYDGGVMELEEACTEPPGRRVQDGIAQSEFDDVPATPDGVPDTSRDLEEVEV